MRAAGTPLKPPLSKGRWRAAGVTEGIALGETDQKFSFFSLGGNPLSQLR